MVRQTMLCSTSAHSLWLSPSVFYSPNNHQVIEKAQQLHVARQTGVKGHCAASYLQHGQGFFVHVQRLLVAAAFASHISQVVLKNAPLIVLATKVLHMPGVSSRM